MGMSAADLRLLIKLRREGALIGDRSVVEIGAQQLSAKMLADRKGLSEIGDLFAATKECPLPAPPPPSYNEDGTLTLKEAPPSQAFWEWLGFSYMAIDIDSSPHSVPLDLNYDEVPVRWRGKFGLVTNFGTTEHVCNQLNAFKCIHDLASTGGIMMHNVPSQGMFCHGLVNYSMKFFWMLARGNGYRWLFATFLPSNPVGVHPYVVDFVAQYDPMIVSRQNTTYTDAAIVVALQKTSEYEFVPPLDTPTGAPAPTKEIERRYWTVFGGPPPTD